jgi:hypothetical protein
MDYDMRGECDNQERAMTFQASEQEIIGIVDGPLRRWGRR